MEYMSNKDIIVTEYIGREGIGELISFEQEKISGRFSNTFLNRPGGKILRNEDRRTPEEKAAAIVGTLKRFGVPAENRFFSEIGEGGIFKTLWDMSEELNCGFQVDLLSIPLRQETIEICEALEINPYCMKSGKEVCLIASDDGWMLCDELKKESIFSTVVGYTLSGKKKILVNNDRIRYLDRPVDDEVFRYKEEHK